VKAFSITGIESETRVELPHILTNGKHDAVNVY
jgi:hypothetical protein